MCQFVLVTNFTTKYKKITLCK